MKPVASSRDSRIVTEEPSEYNKGQNYFWNSKYFYILVREAAEALFYGIIESLLSLLTIDTLTSKPVNPPTSGIHLRNWKSTKSTKSPTLSLRNPASPKSHCHIPTEWLPLSVGFNDLQKRFWVIFIFALIFHQQIISKERDVATGSIDKNWQVQYCHFAL
jgi:hypothetical protein